MNAKIPGTILPAWLLAGGLGLTAPWGMAAPDEVSAEQVVSALEATFGVTPGERRNHTKGTCATGEFVGRPEAATWSRSALFSGDPVPVVARFSLAGGNPKAPDTARSPRGMALEFRLPGGALQHMAMLNTPVFGAAQPATFLDLTVAMPLLAPLIESERAYFARKEAILGEMRIRIFRPQPGGNRDGERTSAVRHRHLHLRIVTDNGHLSEWNAESPAGAPQGIQRRLADSGHPATGHILDHGG